MAAASARTMPCLRTTGPEARQAPVGCGNGLDEHLFDGGLGLELVTQCGQQAVKILVGFVDLEMLGDDRFGEDAVLERVPATLGLALGGARPCGALGVAPVGGELLGGNGLGTGHGSNLRAVMFRAGHKCEKWVRFSKKNPGGSDVLDGGNGRRET